MKKKMQQRRSLRGRVRHFRWHCADCGKGGVAKIELPIQVRRLHDELEESHSKAHPYSMCPSDYFELRGVSNDKLTHGAGE